MNIFRIILIISALLASSSYAQVARKAPWTILVYIAGDNNLDKYIELNLYEMQKGANPNAHILAFVSTHRANQPKLSKKFEITKEHIRQIGPDLLNLDSGDPATAIQAGLWALENYPSDHFAIVFWNHGYGPLNRFRFLGTTLLAQPEKSVCYDDTTLNYLTDYDLRVILKRLKKQFGKKLDIAIFDACLMSSIEIAYTIQDYANYMVASQENVPGTGFAYTGLLSSLAQEIAPAKFAKAIVSSYDAVYKNTKKSYTLSAIDLQQLYDLTDNIKTVADILVQALKKSKKQVAHTLRKAVMHKYTFRFGEPEYADLYMLLTNIYAVTGELNLEEDLTNSLKIVLQNALAGISKIVMLNATSKSHILARGISVYMPQKAPIDSSYVHLYWSKQIPQWHSFVDNYVSKV